MSAMQFPCENLDYSHVGENLREMALAFRPQFGAVDGPPESLRDHILRRSQTRTELTRGEKRLTIHKIGYFIHHCYLHGRWRWYARIQYDSIFYKAQDKYSRHKYFKRI